MSPALPPPPARSDIKYIEIVVALHDYTPTEAGCLALKQGDFIYIHAKDTTGWWEGTCGQRKGWIPSTFIEPVSQAKTNGLSSNGNGGNAMSVDDLTKLNNNDSLERDRNSPSSRDSDEKLPQFWRKKQAPNGQMYYYNTQTNQTTYNLEQVKASNSSKRKSLMWTENGAVAASSEGKPFSVSPPQATWIPGPRSLLGEGQEVTWELLINNILKSISDLNYSAKNDIKLLYLQQASQIVRAIRDMLACSGTISSESDTIRSNRALAAYHSNIMASLSKIILAAKVAAGSWPPPDAVHSMRYQAGQVLLAVRHFVAVAQDLGIEPHPVAHDAIAQEFDLRGNELSDGELIARLDQNCEIIVNSIASLVTKITRDRALSTALIDNVRKTINEVGQYMSLIEDIKFDVALDVDNLVGDFMVKKDNLYIVVNELVTASSTGDDGFAPANGLGMMLESSTSVLEAVEEILVAAKLLIDHKELILQKSLYNETTTERENGGGAAGSALDSELSNLQKRAASLTFLESQLAPSSADSGANGNRFPPASPSSWNRDSRTLSTESRLNTAGSSEQATYYRKNSFSQQQSAPVANKRQSDEGALSPVDSTSASKLSQFFGEQPTNASRISDPTGRPWFLRKEPTYEISYNMEGSVNGGTFAGLVEKLTVHDQPVDPGFAASFLMTFHLFGTAEVLFSLLVSRYSMQPPPGLSPEDIFVWTEKKLIPIQSRVANAIKLWIESYWLEKFDDNILDDLHAFASGPMQDGQASAAQRILELVSKRVATDVYGLNSTTPKMKRAIRPEEFQPSILPKSLKRFVFTDLEPLEVARQLTLIEMNIFMKIQPVELMKQEWSKKNTASQALNVRAMSALDTKITGWVICTILSEADIKRRSVLLKFFIKIAERCLTLNNFNTLLAIQSAFNSSTISRLKKTWELLSNKTRQVFEVLKKATDHSRNYADYRTALKRAALPALPFLGLFLTDLTFTDDGNPDMRNNGKLINFDKYAKTARIISDLTRYQVAYPLLEVTEIQDYLLQSIQDRGTRDVQDLYELSLRLEPRDERASAGSSGPEDVNRELEAKIEMLQKAGML